VDGDGLGVEAVARELVGDLQVGRDRLVRLARAELEVAHLETHVGVARVGVEEGLVVLQGLVERALLQVLLRGLEQFSLVDRRQTGPLVRGPRCAPGAPEARPPFRDSSERPTALLRRRTGPRRGVRGARARAGAPGRRRHAAPRARARTLRSTR